MTIIRTTRMPLGEVRKLLDAGFTLRLVSMESGYSESSLSIMCACWGIKRKRGPKPGTGGRPKMAQ
jgi:hypothetical protein